MAQNRDRNWQDRDQQQRGGGWQGGEDFAQDEHDHQHGFAESQGRGSWDQGREHFGQGQQSGWQGGGQGRFGQGGNYRMDRDYGQSFSHWL